MRYLLNVVETYRVNDDNEAKALIEEAKKDRNYNLTKYTSQQKVKKSKGEIEDEWVRVTLTKEFTEEKDPECLVNISYNTGGVFPTVSNSNEEDDECKF